MHKTNLSAYVIMPDTVLEANIYWYVQVLNEFIYVLNLIIYVYIIYQVC